MPYKGKRKFRFSRNVLSAEENIKISKEQIYKEIMSGRVAGPFENSPFSTLQISPLGLVPKKKPGEIRVIHHLSNPEGTSINDGISKDLCTVQYQTIDDAIKLVKHYGKSSLLSKTDIENSFRLVPINKQNYDLLGFSIDGKFYHEKTLPMGLSYSCKLFEQFSTVISLNIPAIFSVLWNVELNSHFPPNLCR